MLPKLSLVIGGAASGKSSFAEHLIVATGQPRRYIATAQVYDAEMAAKVERHRVQRGPDWITVEAPLDIATALSEAQQGEVVLFDCATLWLTNHLLNGHDIDEQAEKLITAFKTCPAEVVIVSNEVGAGVVPENALSRQFREAQGKLNQRLATESDLVVTVMAGLPLVLKGQLPEMSQ